MRSTRGKRKRPGPRDPRPRGRAAAAIVRIARPPGENRTDHARQGALLSKSRRRTLQLTTRLEACRRWHTIAPAAPLVPRENPRGVFRRGGHVAASLVAITARLRLFRQDHDR